jgi:hypothetical protein
MIARSLLLALVYAVLTVANAENPAPAKPAASGIRFTAYDVNPRRPDDVTVQIHVNGRTHFKGVGEQIQGTNYKVQAFEKKEVARPDGTKEDRSEITLLDTKTNATTVVSIRNRMVESARAQ